MFYAVGPMSKAPASAPLANAHLFHYCAHKSGMGMDVSEKERQAKIIEEMSKGSQFYIRQVEQSRKAEEKGIEMMAKLNSMDNRDIILAQRHASDRVIETEKRRNFSRVLAVLDMDMFFAAVEIRDQPHLKELPVAVGGSSMISTTNYVARKFGVRSAMPGFIGKKLCPTLIFVSPNYEKYEMVAEQIRAIIKEYDPKFTSHSCDEVYMDLTHAAEIRLQQSNENSSCSSSSSSSNSGSSSSSSTGGDIVEADPYLLRLRVAACEVLHEIRQRVTATTGGLTCSAGLANNFMLAKVTQFNSIVVSFNLSLPTLSIRTISYSFAIAPHSVLNRFDHFSIPFLLTSHWLCYEQICADMNKPDGQFECPCTRQGVLNFMETLPTRKLGGIGKVQEKLLSSLGMAKSKYLPILSPLFSLTHFITCIP